LLLAVRAMRITIAKTFIDPSILLYGAWLLALVIILE